MMVKPIFDTNDVLLYHFHSLCGFELLVVRSAMTMSDFSGAAGIYPRNFRRTKILLFYYSLQFFGRFPRITEIFLIYK